MIFRIPAPLFVMVLIIPSNAVANAIIPYMSVPWGQMFLFPLIVLIESIVLTVAIRKPFWISLTVSIIANLISTVLGAVIYVMTMIKISHHLFPWWANGHIGSKEIRSLIIAFLFTGLLFVISWASETFVISRVLKVKWDRISKYCVKANLISYFPLGILLIIAAFY